MRVSFPILASGMVVLLAAQMVTYLDQHYFLSRLIAGDEINMLKTGHR